MQPTSKAVRLVAILSAATAVAVAAALPAAQAQDTFGNAGSPTFGSRTDKPDGSVALTFGKRLPTEWETKFGLDANLPPDRPAAGAETLRADGNRSSTGALWGSMTGPSVAPLIFDK